MVNRPSVCGMRLITHKDCIMYTFISVYHVQVSNIVWLTISVCSQNVLKTVYLFYNIYALGNNVCTSEMQYLYFVNNTILSHKSL